MLTVTTIGPFSWTELAVAVIGSGGIGALLKALVDTYGKRVKPRSESGRDDAEADLTDAEADGLRLTQSMNLFDFIEDKVNERVSAKVKSLEDRIAELEGRVEREHDVRHQLKGALIYVVTVAKQAVAVIEETWTDEQIAQLPQPLRGHVLGLQNFDDHIDMTRAQAPRG